MTAAAMDIWDKKRKTEGMEKVYGELFLELYAINILQLFLFVVDSVIL